jgi:hypothetical protein
MRINTPDVVEKTRRIVLDSILNCRICIAQGTTWQEIEIETPELMPAFTRAAAIERHHSFGTAMNAEGGIGINLEALPQCCRLPAGRGTKWP